MSTPTVAASFDHRVLQVVLPRQEVCEPIRVFLVDAHEVVRAGLKGLLEIGGDIEVVGEAGTATAAIARMPALNPDVAVLDVRLPDGNGLDVCRDLRSSHPGIRVIILTPFDDGEALSAAVMAGAAGCVLTQVTGQDLVSAVKVAAEGGSLRDPRALAKVKARLQACAPQEPEELKCLTPQERRLLELVAEGLTNKQIGVRLFLAEKTVRNYMSNVLAKLGLERRTQAAVLATRLIDGRRACWVEGHSHQEAAPGRTR